MEAWVNEARESLLQRRSSLRALLRGNELAGMADSRWEEARALRARLELKELQDINEALVRIEEGRFGHCARCGGAIGRHRLRAVPEAKHCMACSTQSGR